MIFNLRRSAGAAAALLLGALAACAEAPTATFPAAASPTRSAQASPVDFPRFQSRTPTYPAIAVHIVNREYVNQNPGLLRVEPDDPRYQRYVEKRLRELYPERGHSGMMRESVAEMREHNRRYREYERARRADQGGVGTQSCDIHMYSISSAPCEPGGGGGGGGGTTYPPPSPLYHDDGSWASQLEFWTDQYAVLSVQQEADSLQLSPDEYNRLVYYESLALGNDGGYELQGTSEGLSRDDLIRMAATGAMPGEVTTQVTWVEIVAVPIGVGLVCGVRAVFAYHRAKSAAASYYPALNPADTKHDAFRHVYGSVMLARYCTPTVAKAITDLNEWRGANPWGSRVMDYHNNDLGREVRYQHFRGHWFWDRWSWGVWGHNVRRYIDDPANGAFVPALLEPGLTESAAKAIRQPVPNYLYIYIRE